jgi:hypothetical protein
MPSPITPAPMTTTFSLALARETDCATRRLPTLA